MGDNRNLIRQDFGIKINDLCPKIFAEIRAFILLSLFDIDFLNPRIARDDRCYLSKPLNCSSILLGSSQNDLL